MRRLVSSVLRQDELGFVPIGVSMPCESNLAQTERIAALAFDRIRLGTGAELLKYYCLLNMAIIILKVVPTLIFHLFCC